MGSKARVRRRSRWVRRIQIASGDLDRSCACLRHAWAGIGIWVVGGIYEVSLRQMDHVWYVDPGEIARDCDRHQQEG